jgi:hypothetical protein
MDEMSAAIELQRVIYERLTASPGVTAHVPAENIFDRSGRPERFPCVVMGEAQEIVEDLTFGRNLVTVAATLHVWSRDPGTIEAKEIVGGIRQALTHYLAPLDAGRLIDLRFEGARYLRDPDGETTHAVITIEALIDEATA